MSTVSHSFKILVALEQLLIVSTILVGKYWIIYLFGLKLYKYKYTESGNWNELIILCIVSFVKPAHKYTVF